MQLLSTVIYCLFYTLLNISSSISIFYRYSKSRLCSFALHRRLLLYEEIENEESWSYSLLFLEITESIKPYSKASAALIKLSLSVSRLISSIVRPVFSASI